MTPKLITLCLLVFFFQATSLAEAPLYFRNLDKLEKRSGTPDVLWVLQKRLQIELNRPLNSQQNLDLISHILKYMNERIGIPIKNYNNEQRIKTLSRVMDVCLNKHLSCVNETVFSIFYLAPKDKTYSIFLNAYRSTTDNNIKQSIAFNLIEIVLENGLKKHIESTRSLLSSFRPREPSFLYNFWTKRLTFFNSDSCDKSITTDMWTNYLNAFCLVQNKDFKNAKILFQSAFHTLKKKKGKIERHELYIPLKVASSYINNSQNKEALIILNHFSGVAKQSGFLLDFYFNLETCRAKDYSKYSKSCAYFMDSKNIAPIKNFSINILFTLTRAKVKNDIHQINKIKVKATKTNAIKSELISTYF